MTIVCVGRRVARCAAVVACAAAHTAAAQNAPPATVTVGVTLEDVVRSTLRDAPNVRAAARTADNERGVLVAAGDPFDARLQTSFGNTRSNTLQGDAATSLAPWLQISQTQYSIGVQKQLRDGIILAPELDVSRTALPSLPIASTSQATAKLSLLVPLLKDRGGVVSSAPERSAASGYAAATIATEHVAAQSVLMSVAAYWDYQAAIARVDVLADSERRAQRLLDDTQRLVEAGERPPSDLRQVRGNASAKRVTRISAEQAVVDARARLGIAMGIGPAETMALGPAATAFPAVDAAQAASLAAETLVEQALDRRPDLRATRKSVESARLLSEGARENLKPRVDLLASVGYDGLQVGGGLGSLVTPVVRNVPGPDFAISFRYQWATANVGARGALLQDEAVYEQQRISEQDLQRQIRIAVHQATEAIGRNAAATTEAHDAVAFYEATVRSEQRKFQLGVSTLFDTINAADALTNVKLSEIAAEHDYAVAIATLRYQTGMLVAAGSQGPTVDVERLLAPQ